MDIAPEILINAIEIGHQEYGDSYEFVLNMDMQVVECVKIESLIHGIITQIDNCYSTLKDKLFELNHVRVNPNADSSSIINNLTKSLEEIGVLVKNIPNQESASMHFKPLGEISDTVRFRIGKDNQIIFLSPANRLKLVYNAEKTHNRPSKH